MDSAQIVFLVILAGTLALFISERVRIDIAAMLALLALGFTGILTPAEALAGFSSEPAIIVAAVFVMSAGLNATGVTERLGALIARGAGSSEPRAIVVIMPAVAALAAFSHHLMITAMMLPIVMRVARDQSLPASRLLMQTTERRALFISARSTTRNRCAHHPAWSRSAISSRN